MMARVFAWGVHAYTALGAVLSYLIVTASVAGNYKRAFAWMLVATFIDATDGWLARRVRVSSVLPRVNGARLDDIVDYLTFVFAPAVLLAQAGALADRLGAVAVVAMLMSSSYGFAREDAKTADHFFTGFPSYWNIVAFYLYAARASPAVNAAVVLTLAALVFVPIAYVYPTRTPTLKPLTLVLAGLWAAVLIVLVRQLPAVNRPLLTASLAYPIYYLILSLVLNSRRGASRAAQG